MNYFTVNFLRNVKTQKHFAELFIPLKGQEPALDGVKAIAVFSVIGFHVLFGVLRTLSADSRLVWISELPSWSWYIFHGEKAVDAFLVISAIVLGVPMFRELNRTGSVAILSFFRRRFWRIYPIYLLSLIFYFAIQYRTYSGHFLSNLFLVNHLIPGQRNVVPVGWSLNLEVQLYVFMPFILIVLHHLRKIGLGLWILFAASIGITAWVVTQNPEFTLRPLSDLMVSDDHGSFSKRMGKQIYEAFDTRFGPFILGLWFAFIRVNHWETLQRLFSKSRFSTLIFMAGSLMVLGSLSPPLFNPNSFLYKPEHSPDRQFWILVLSRPVFSLGITLLFLGCAVQPAQSVIWGRLNKVLSWRGWFPISRLAYPIYLFHFPWIAVSAAVVLGTVHLKDINSIEMWQGAVIFVLSVVLSVLVALPIHLWLERPLMEFGRKK